MSWLSKLFRGAQQKSPKDLAVLVNDYGRVLAEGTTIERDESELPFSKELIRKGMLEAIRMTTDDEMREHLKSGYVSLADFQDLKRLRNEGKSAPNEIVEEAERLLNELKAQGL